MQPRVHALLLTVVVVVALLLAPSARAQDAQLQQCPCGDGNPGFCLPKGGVLLQRFLAAAPLCEASGDPCVDGQSLQLSLKILADEARAEPDGDQVVTAL
ncbi:hypothetical protein ONE63_003684 [Megalurothrips usitatus]|uniref:Uncharacterized protein n=1 Tax=Megalurothrips usitatus TaxID=439358 RepID=A0AAV7X7P0_9NEOP|nr:hypothetical protein ONE63_003684 [Megalurothrips usitatus]